LVPWEGLENSCNQKRTGEKKKQMMEMCLIASIQISNMNPHVRGRGTNVVGKKGDILMDVGFLWWAGGLAAEISEKLKESVIVQ